MWRTTLFSSGAFLLALGLVPPIAEFAHEDFRGHMVQHLALGMLAPLGLVLGAPLTLLMATLPKSLARKTAQFLRLSPLQKLSHPVSALFLNLGGMYLLYLTPLYSASLSSGLLHLLVHLHFIVAGCLFTWAIAGPDPGPRRPSYMYRFVILFLSMAGHAILAKMIYAYGWPQGTHHDLAEIQSGAKLMYYAGDGAEVLLLIALLIGWKQSQQKNGPNWGHSWL